MNTPRWTRRQLLCSAAAASMAGAAGPKRSRMTVASYIWTQWLQGQKKSLKEGLDLIFPMARRAGFENIELMQNFYTPELTERTLELLKANELETPSVYVGGAMHETSVAEKTIARAHEVAALAKRSGCGQIVNNPDPKAGRVPKTDAELELQAHMLNRLGRELSGEGVKFAVHHHNPEMADNAREWRHILQHTEPQYVSLCMDVDWVYQGGQDPLKLLGEAGTRIAELHLRSARSLLWLEALEDSDIDYHKIAAHLKQHRIAPILAVELAYKKETKVTRPLEEDLRLSRIYAEKVFGVKARG